MLKLASLPCHGLSGVRPFKKSERTRSTCKLRKFHTRVHAKNDKPEDEDGEPAPDSGKVDIDQLAKRLSEEAEKLRKRGENNFPDGAVGSGFFEEGATEDTVEQGDREIWDEGGPDDELASFDEQMNQDPVRDIETALLEDIGEGGFTADEFELIQQLGYLTIQSFHPRDNILENSQVAKERKAVIAFVARYYSGRPYEFPVTTLLKEYLPAAEGVAGNELMIMKELCGLPKTKCEVLHNPQPHPPVVRLLGYFLATPSESATSSAVDPEEVAITDARGRSIWLVHQWEKMKPLSGFWKFDQAETAPTWPWQKPKETALDLRKNMLRQILKGIVDALSYCHTRCIAHGSLGSGSVLLSTYDARDAKELLVKFDNFGFARHLPKFDGNGKEERNLPGVGGFRNKNLSAGFQQDLQATGLLLLETVIMSLTNKSKLQNVSKETIERLVMDVFRDDFDSLRSYCENEYDWSEAASFLENREDAGWNLLRALLMGTEQAEALTNCPFFE